MTNEEHESISRIVLASSSPRRKELVASLDLSLPVYILSTDSDETVQEGWSPRETVETLSLRKAQAALNLLRHNPAHNSTPGDLIIAADTIVTIDGDILGKPASDNEAANMLRRLSGRVHDVYTGVVCLSVRSGKTNIQHKRTSVRMRVLSDKRIERYVATGEPRDKAGAYGIQGLGGALVEGIEGCYFNVVGLPLALLSDMLAEYGIETV